MINFIMEEKAVHGSFSCLQAFFRAKRVVEITIRLQRSRVTKAGGVYDEDDRNGHQVFRAGLEILIQLVLYSHKKLNLDSDAF